MVRDASDRKPFVALPMTRPDPADIVHDTTPRHAPAWRRVISIVLALPVLVSAAALAYAWLLPQDLTNANRYYVAAATAAFIVRTVQLHLAAALLCWVPVALLARRRRVALAGLVLSIVSAAPFLGDFFTKSPPTISGPTFRLMSVNTFVWNRDREALVAEIRRADPDVLIVVENTRQNRAAIETAFVDRFTHRFDIHRTSHATIYSRLPLRRDATMGGRDDDPLTRVFVTIDWQGRPIALNGVHLVSPGGRWTISRNRLQHAALVDQLARRDKPVIVAGDFNVTQLSPNHRALLRAGLHSTHTQAGRGLGNTWAPIGWPAPGLIGVRIDHVMLSEELAAVSHEVGRDCGSDHRPLIVDIGWRDVPTN
jgi:endonuclease/exonuclease/phosphatase (EEP) superfamily protein YafD